MPNISEISHNFSQYYSRELEFIVRQDNLLDWYQHFLRLAKQTVKSRKQTTRNIEIFSRFAKDFHHFVKYSQDFYRLALSGWIFWQNLILNTDVLLFHSLWYSIFYWLGPNPWREGQMGQCEGNLLGLSGPWISNILDCDVWSSPPQSHYGTYLKSRYSKMETFMGKMSLLLYHYLSSFYDIFRVNEKFRNHFSLTFFCEGRNISCERMTPFKSAKFIVL